MCTRSDNGSSEEPIENSLQCHEDDDNGLKCEQDLIID